MSIKIGDKNKIKGSKIGHQYGTTSVNDNEQDKRKSFIEKHPIIISFFISLMAGFILLFSFWRDIVDFIESIFK